MTNRERIINTIIGEQTDRAPFFVWFSMKPWKETTERWLREGLDRAEDWNRLSGFDPGVTEIDRNLLGMYPGYDEATLEERESTLVIRDRLGVVKEVGKGYSSLPKYLEFPIKNRDDWEKMRAEQFDPDVSGRFAENWEKELTAGDRREQYLQIGEYPYGLFGYLRELMGIENFLLSCYEQPELISVMMSDLADFWIEIYKRVLKKVRIDHIHMWEDMSGNHGSLMSPDMMREFMLPNYLKVAEFAKENSIPVFSVDTDGKVDKIIPVFIEAGMNLMWPFEVRAGNHVIGIRNEYPNLAIMGGIDKMALSLGKEAIDRELEKVSPLIGSRYIPGLDHAVPPEVSWENFLYYAERLREITCRAFGRR